MSLPHDADHDPDHDNEELVRYVLGLLPDEATERLDEASIADDEVAARLRIVETNLIDSYVRGQLAGATLERFESYYLSSPRRRESVRWRRGFVRVVDRSAARIEGVTWKDRIASRTSLARIVAAAALVIVVSWSPPVPGRATSERVDARDVRERGGRAQDRRRCSSNAQANHRPARRPPEGWTAAARQRLRRPRPLRLPDRPTVNEQRHREESWRLFCFLRRELPRQSRRLPFPLAPIAFGSSCGSNRTTFRAIALD